MQKFLTDTFGLEANKDIGLVKYTFEGVGPEKKMSVGPIPKSDLHKRLWA